ncbi:hypothetical protein ACOME3_005970 [Neoechinorhynchus agilis]
MTNRDTHQGFIEQKSVVDRGSIGYRSSDEEAETGEGSGGALVMDEDQTERKPSTLLTTNDHQQKDETNMDYLDEDDATKCLRWIEKDMDSMIKANIPIVESDIKNKIGKSYELTDDPRFRYLAYLRSMNLEDTTTLNHPYDFVISMDVVTDPIKIKTTTMTSNQTEDLICMTAWLLNLDIPLDQVAKYLSELISRRYLGLWNVALGRFLSICLAHNAKSMLFLSFGRLEVIIFLNSYATGSHNYNRSFSSEVDIFEE